MTRIINKNEFLNTKEKQQPRDTTPNEDVLLNRQMSKEQNDFRLIVEKSWVSFIQHVKPAQRWKKM